jgi:hypothetical protein
MKGVIRKNWHYRVRRIHRYLGVFIGIQFFLWTLGGLYFSWSDMDKVHGDHLKAPTHTISPDFAWSNPQDIIQAIKAKDSLHAIFDMRLIQILGQPYYQVIYSNGLDGGKKIQLAHAVSGALRGELTNTEATEIAKHSVSNPGNVLKTEYLTTTNGHHEYRDQPLPAYAIFFEHEEDITVYVSAQLGTVQKFRNNSWRNFDFLWMLHTMDYKSRDNISNWILRILSILGLLTILSGFTLFWLSIRRKKR